MSEQTYEPYRTQLLSRSELSLLNKLRPRIALRDIAVLWTEIVAAWSTAALVPTWWIIAIAACLVGNRYYSLFIIGHDGLHRRLYPRQKINDSINDLLVLGPIGAITRVNRGNHMTHHGTLALPDDPDAYKYVSRSAHGPLGFLFSLTALTFVWRAVRNVFVGDKKALNQETYRFRDWAIIAGWQCLLATALTFAFGWWGYFAMWWIPVYVFTFCADLVRVFCEHSTCPDRLSTDLSARLVSFSAPKWELAIFAPMNMNNHIAHHLWPSIPYYNLPAATQALETSMASLGAAVQRLLVRRSYVRHLKSCFLSTFRRG